MDDHDKSTFGQVKDELTLVCVATHYEGEPTDNTAEFYRWTQELKREKSKLFKNLNFGVFGLGDTAYEKYNSMGKYFDKIFEDLGGQRMIEAGVGNS